MKSSINRPTSLSANAVQTAVLSPKHRRIPRATLYSPPPSQTLNSRAVLTRPSPGSKRSMISPNATRSNLHEAAGLMFRMDMCAELFCRRFIYFRKRLSYERFPFRAANPAWMRYISIARPGSECDWKILLAPGFLMDAHEIAVFIHGSSHCHAAVAHFDLVQPRQDLHAKSVVET